MMASFSIRTAVLSMMAALSCSDATGAAGPPGFVARTVADAGTTYGYRVFVPTSYDATHAWPVILYLHGSGETGTDNVKQIETGLGAYVSQHRDDFPAIVVFPQAPRETQWNGRMARVAFEALDATMRQYNIDPARVYLTGISLGGFGTWELALEQPRRFAALMPIASGLRAPCPQGNCPLLVTAIPATTPDPYMYTAQHLSGVPIWVFHGSADPNVPVSGARQLVADLRSLGAPVKYTEYAGAGHDVWDMTYADPAVWEWMFAQAKR
jgi:predicted peptidase